MTTAGDDFVTLFQEILIDLPVGEYFRKFIDTSIEVLRADSGKDGGDKNAVVSADKVTDMINDINSSDMKILLKKIWLI